MTLQIREALRSDLDSLVRLHEPLHQLFVRSSPRLAKEAIDPREVRDFFEAVLDGPESTIAVAGIDGVVSGFIWFHVVALPERLFGRASRHLYIIAIAVAPGAQRRGVGSALVRHVKARALEEKAEEILLDVYPANSSAQQFYKASGFLAVTEKLRLPLDGAGV
jgi:ribosomal protein S18 acetylase RimI-like enzyme